MSGTRTEVFFALEKSTKGAHRYMEVDDNSNQVKVKDGALIGTLYLRKTFIGDNPPQAITVIIVRH